MADLTIVKSEPAQGLQIVKSEPVSGHSWLDSVVDAASDYRKGIVNGLAESGQGLVDAATTNPLTTLKNIGASQDAIRLKAEAAFKRGDYAEGIRHALSYAVPLVGPSIDQAGDEAQAGRVAHALGKATVIGGQMVAPEALKLNAAPLAAAADTAATATKGALKGAGQAAVEPVKYGHLRIPVPAPIAGGGVGGYAAGQLGLPHAAGAVVGAAVPIIRGAIKGAKAALAERLPAAVDAEGAVGAALTPGQALAQESGTDWAKLSPQDKAMLETVARAQSNAAAQPAARTAPVSTDSVPSEIAPAPTGPQTIQEMMQAEMAARQAAQPAAPVPASPPIGAHRVVPPVNGRGAPIQPPLRQSVPTVAPPEAVPSAAPPLAPPAQEPMVQPPTPPTVNPAAVSASRNPAELAKAAGLPPDATPKQIAQAIYDSMNQRGALPPTEVAAPSTQDLSATADLMRQVPRSARKAIADANYRAVKEGNAAPETAAPTYESAARATKVEPVVRALLDHGVKYSDLVKLTKSEMKAYVDKLSAATSAEGAAHPGNVFSKLSVDELLGEMRRAEGRGVRRIK